MTILQIICLIYELTYSSSIFCTIATFRQTGKGNLLTKAGVKLTSCDAFIHVRLCPNPIFKSQTLETRV